jgi:transposase
MDSKIDSRKLPDSVREEMRREIIRLRLQGETNRSAAKAVGISERHANVIWQNYLQSEDMPLFVWKRRGRRKGEQRSISHAQELSLLSMLLNVPAKMKFRSELWTRQLFVRAIERRVNIDMPMRTAGEYLRRWGLIPQKPFELCSKIKSPKLQAWIDDDYQNFVRQAKSEGGEVHWFVVKTLGGGISKIYDDLYTEKKKKAALLIATITNRGQIRFMLGRSEMSSTVFVDFMSRLSNDAGRKVFLLAKPVKGMNHDSVKTWFAENASKLELIYLPPFA